MKNGDDAVSKYAALFCALLAYQYCKSWWEPKPLPAMPLNYDWKLDKPLQSGLLPSGEIRLPGSGSLSKSVLDDLKPAQNEDFDALLKRLQEKSNPLMNPNWQLRGLDGNPTPDTAPEKPVTECAETAETG